MITIPGRLPLLNELNRKHWAVRAKLKMEWGSYVAYRAYASYVPQLSRARVTITRYGANQCDYDNLVGGCKAVVDGLKVARVIADDSPQCVQVTYRSEKSTRTDARVEIVIEPWELGPCSPTS